jgi:hypothetical protein
MQIADHEGRYRFSGISPYVNYEIHAEQGEWVSSVHRLSALHSQREVVRDLKIDKRKAPTVVVPRTLR